MNKYIYRSTLALFGLFWLMPVHAAGSQNLNIYEVMQRVLDRYPLLKISEYDVARAAEQKQQVESSLGWILQANTGLKHDLSAFGTPSDTMDVNGSLSRRLQSGSTISVTGSYRYEDSAFVFSSAFPNPFTTTRLDLNYRMPLAQGSGNPQYQQGIISAEASHELAQANMELTRINLAEQVKDLFYGLALTRIRLDNARQAVKRTRKLEKYILSNVKLGLLDKKDRLQVQAQLNNTRADVTNIQVQLRNQLRLLNRLLQDDWDQKTNPVLLKPGNKNYASEQLVQMALDYHPAIRASRAKIKIAESKIASARDSRKDNLDLVLSVGTRATNGDSNTGVIKASDWAGSVSLEYKHLFDEKGVSSEYRQAQLDKNIALQELNKNEDDLRYSVSGLVSEIYAARKAVAAALRKEKSEAKKLSEAEQRYRTGRADIAQIIQFQNEYSFARLAYQSRKVELNNRILALKIITGQFWNELNNRHGVEK